jgi:glycopeptide antibiotics resistance protein
MIRRHGREGRVGAYGTAAAAFVAFAAWGSLYPFDFRIVTARDAFDLFTAPWRAGAATWSITDLASNVILFVPIGLFVAATLESRAGSTSRWIAGVAALALAVLLSVSLEMTQAFLPYRTASLVDVMAETAGAFTGVVAWCVARDPFNNALAGAVAALRRASTPRRLLLAYCAVFAIAWLLPLDFTIRPQEIADKYLHQRLLPPLRPSPDAATPFDLGMALLAGIPLGAAAVLGGGAPGERRPLASALAVAIALLVLLELAQATVFSRTTDATSLLALMAGASAGALVGHLVGPTRRPG